MYHQDILREILKICFETPNARYYPYIENSIVYTKLLTALRSNSLRAKFFRENINIYSHFMSLIHIDMTQVLKILSQVRPGPTYST